MKVLVVCVRSDRVLNWGSKSGRPVHDSSCRWCSGLFYLSCAARRSFFSSIRVRVPMKHIPRFPISCSPILLAVLIPICTIYQILSLDWIHSSFHTTYQDLNLWHLPKGSSDFFCHCKRPWRACRDLDWSSHTYLLRRPFLEISANAFYTSMLQELGQYRSGNYLTHRNRVLSELHRALSKITSPFHSQTRV